MFLQKELRKFIEFIKNNGILLVSLFITVLLTYGYEMSNFALTIDEEANWNRTGMECFISRISDGRFFLGFLKLFFPRIFLPFWSTAVFSLGMVLSGCLLCYIFKDHFKSTVAKVAAACIFVSFPVHAFYVMFSIMSAEAALCYFMTIYAVYLMDKSLKRGKVGVKDFLLPGLFIVLVNGVYQAFLMVYVILVCALIAFDLLAENNTEANEAASKVKAYWKRIGGQVVCLVTSSISYLLIVKILQALINPSRNYIESYLDWGTYGFVETIKVFVQAIIRISWSTHDDQSYVTMWFFTALFVVLFVVGLWRCGKKYKLLYFIAMIGLFFSNFLMMFVAGNTIPVRLYVTLPIYAALVLAIFIELAARENTKTVFGIVVALVILVQSANVTDLFWAEDRRQENDKVMMTKLTSDIAELGGSWLPEEPVIIFSSTSYENYEGTFGFSYFTLGGRIYGYLSANGFDYMTANKEQRAYATERVKTMPAFPAEGSIVKEEGVIIVNMQEQ